MKMASLNGIWFIITGLIVSIISFFGDGLEIFIYIGMLFLVYGAFKLAYQYIMDPKKENKVSSHQGHHPHPAHHPTNHPANATHKSQHPHSTHPVHPAQKATYKQQPHPNHPVNAQNNQQHTFFCKNCGKRLYPNDNFCPNCGLRLR